MAMKRSPAVEQIVEYEAQLLDENNTWPVVQAENVRQLSKLTMDAEQAFEKIFARYSSNGVIERLALRQPKATLHVERLGGGLRGLLSCATNEYIPEECSMHREP
ncbi:UBP5 [Symbiodinium natans]|uniref:UBP5 protein n=1 Tax=Symbiodinium natans TaxID=878477 RepID=A0A812V987_9DINO|nr:UBP5 [Symbiodinium natans]